MPTNKLILIGFMGAGKTSVAKLLADKLGYSTIDMDQEILALSGYRSIQEIFADLGEAGFREMESSVASRLRDATHITIATGGGVVGSESNMASLKHNGIAIYLKAPFKTHQSRALELHNRPLFKDPQAAERLFTSREELYNRYADLTIDTDQLSVEQVTEAIIKLL